MYTCIFSYKTMIVISDDSKFLLGCYSDEINVMIFVMYLALYLNKSFLLVLFKVLLVFSKTIVLNK